MIRMPLLVPVYLKIKADILKVLRSLSWTLALGPDMLAKLCDQRSLLHSQNCGPQDYRNNNFHVMSS